MSEKEQITVRIPKQHAQWLRDCGYRPQKVLESAIERLQGLADPKARIKQIDEVMIRLRDEKKDLESKMLEAAASRNHRMVIEFGVAAALEKDSEVFNKEVFQEAVKSKLAEGYELLPMTDRELSQYVNATWHTMRKSYHKQQVIPGSIY